MRRGPRRWKVTGQVALVAAHCCQDGVRRAGLGAGKQGVRAGKPAAHRGHQRGVHEQLQRYRRCRLGCGDSLSGVKMPTVKLLTAVDRQLQAPAGRAQRGHRAHPQQARAGLTSGDEPDPGPEAPAATLAETSSAAHLARARKHLPSAERTPESAQRPGNLVTHGDGHRAVFVTASGQIQLAAVTTARVRATIGLYRGPTRAREHPPAPLSESWTLQGIRPRKRRCPAARRSAGRRGRKPHPFRMTLQLLALTGQLLAEGGQGLVGGQRAGRGAVVRTRRAVAATARAAAGRLGGHGGLAARARARRDRSRHL